VSGITWKDVSLENVEKIRSYFLKNGGIEKEVEGEYETWRISFSDTTVTYFSTGTLYSNESPSKDPAITEAWDFIEGLTGPRYIKPTKEFLIGFDETGKGELFGHTVLAGAIIPSELFLEIDRIIGAADTKKRRSYSFWDELFQKFDHLKKKGLDFSIETIPPWVIDKYNINKIMDVTYQRQLNMFYRDVDMSKARIVIDNYSVGPTLMRYINMLESQGSEIIVTSDAESSYLEVKLASLLAKRHSQRSIEAIKSNPEFQINGINIGSGNAGDEKTKTWLEAWKKSGQEWPWFVKRSFKTILTLDGKPKMKKEQPLLNESLLSKEFIEKFNKGELSIQSLSVVCPHCGTIMKSARLIFLEEAGRPISRLICCEECNQELVDAGSTLRYYCGFVIPDNNALSRKIIGRDLTRSRIFDNFTIVLSPVVRYESDGMRGARQELVELRRFSNMGRVNLISPGNLVGIESLNSSERDERIIQDCIRYNGIFLTADKAATTYAIGKGVFTISV